MDIKNNYQKEKRFALAIGCLYAVAGLVQFIQGTGLPEYLALPEIFFRVANALFIPSDILGGLVLLVIGATFLTGANELKTGLPEGKAYVYVGTLLAITFAFVYLLTMSGNAFEAFVLGSEDFENWTLLSDMKPGIYLAVLAIPAYLSRKTRFSMGSAAGE